MKRRHRKAHRILSLLLLVGATTVVALAYRSWSGAPVPDTIDPRLGTPSEAPAP